MNDGGPNYKIGSRCERCGSDGRILTGSYFNTEMICADVCQPKEAAHTKYGEARRVEAEHVQAGNYNFPGIGLPLELRARPT